VTEVVDSRINGCHLPGENQIVGRRSESLSFHDVGLSNDSRHGQESKRHLPFYGAYFENVLQAFTRTPRPRLGEKSMFKRLLRAILPAALRRRLQRFKLDRHLGGFERRTVRHTYAGVPLDVELADGLAAGWYDHDWPNQPEIEVLRRSRLRPGALVFDIGAHQGVVGLVLANRVGPTGRVVMLEPIPHNAEQCRRNIHLNAAVGVTVRQAAVSDVSGRLRICGGLNGQGADLSDYAGSIDVECTTVDELARIEGPPNVVFIDVEGYEARVLRGAATTLATDADWFVEVHVGYGLEAAGDTVEDVLKHFPATKYVRYVHNENDAEAILLEQAPPTVLAKRFFLTAVARATNK
jgi:FkbM family methyltransferase